MSSEGSGVSAGALLRAAREKQGLHIAALAAAIKVAPKKLEALENDRYDELSGATFTRALAQTVCRALRIEPQPVLALLPQPEAVELDHVTGRLNAPFRDRPSRDDNGMAVLTQRSLIGAGLVFLVAAVLTYFAPASLFKRDAVAPAPAPAPAASAPASATAGSAAAATAQQASASVVVAASVPATSTIGPTTPMVPAAQLPVAAAPEAAPVAAASGTGPLQIGTTQTSWIEVRDAGSRVLLSRQVAAGETLALDGTPPFHLVIGNAAMTQLRYRGKAIDLKPSTRDNVARLELP